jgi:hypothetical protein
MDFRTNKSRPLSYSATTSRNYGVYGNNLVFVYDKPLTDRQVEWITREVERQEKLQAALDTFITAKLERDLEPQIDKAVEKTIGKELEKAFSNRR